MRKNTLMGKTLAIVLVMCFLLCPTIFISQNTVCGSNNETESTIMATSQLTVEVSIAKIKVDRPTDITVKVKDAYGNPVSNATVLLYISNSYQQRPGETVANGTTNQEGIAEFRGVVIDYASEDVSLYINAEYNGVYGYTQIPTEEVTFFEELGEGLCVPASLIALFLGIALLGYGVFSNVGKERGSKARFAVPILGIIFIALAVWVMLSVPTVGDALKPIVTIFSSIFGIVLLISSGYILSKKSSRNLRTGAGGIAAGIVLLCIAGIFIRESIEIMSPMAPWLMLIFAGAGCVLAFLGTMWSMQNKRGFGMLSLFGSIIFLSLSMFMNGGEVSQNNYALLFLVISAITGVIFVVSAILRMARDGEHIFTNSFVGLLFMCIASVLVYETGWFGNYSFLLLSISTTAIAFSFTINVWKAATVETQKRYQSMAASGLYKKYGDPESNTSSLKHVEGERIFKEWRNNLTAMKDAELFMPESLLKSFKYLYSNKFYGGFYEAEEEVEYFSEDKIVKKINEPYQLDPDPKPKPPTSFRNETQIYPYDQYEKECSTCKGTGEVTCPKCNGSGKEKCSNCGGRGYKQRGVVKSREGVKSGGPIRAEIYTEVRKLRHADGTVYGEVKSPHAVTIGSSAGRMDTTKIEIESYTCPTCKGSGLSTTPCNRCHGKGKVTCQECGGHGKLRVLKRKIWEYKHETGYGKVLPEKCYATPSAKELLTINEEEFEKIDTLEFKDEDKVAKPPTIKEILKKLRSDYENWVARKKGKVVLNAHKAFVFPVTECIVEYPSEKGKKKFSIWGAGNQRNWVIHAETTPIKKTPKFFLRHVLFSLITISEIFAVIILHRLLIFT
ncbi:MAG: hypothetical protein QXU48_03420 [Thermoplasmata archaeon]